MPNSIMPKRTMANGPRMLAMARVRPPMPAMRMPTPAAVLTRADASLGFSTIQLLTLPTTEASDWVDAAQRAVLLFLELNAEVFPGAGQLIDIAHQVVAHDLGGALGFAVGLTQGADERLQCTGTG